MLQLYDLGMGRTWEKFSSSPAKKTQKFETATGKWKTFRQKRRVALVGDNCQHQISNLFAWRCHPKLYENLPAPPKHYGVFDVLPIRKVFPKAKNLRSH